MGIINNTYLEHLHSIKEGQPKAKLLKYRLRQLGLLITSNDLYKNDKCRKEIIKHDNFWKVVRLGVSFINIAKLFETVIGLKRA